MTLRGAPDRNSPTGEDDPDLVDVFDEPDQPDPLPEGEGEGTQDAKTRPPLLEVVRDVVAKGREAALAAASSDSTADGQPPTAVDAQTDPSAAQAADEFKDVPFHTHPRFQALVAERNQLREIATSHGKIREAIEDSGLTGEEFSQTLAIASLMRSDPLKAFELLAPVMKQLGIDSGVILPKDIAAEIQAGRMTKQHGIELSKIRAKQANDAKWREFQEKRNEARQHRTTREEAVSQVSAWERRVATTDPDYGRIKDGVHRRLAVRMNAHIQAGGGPVTSADALKWAKEEYRAEKDYLRPSAAAVRQARPGIRTPIGSRAAANGAAGVPKSPLDAARRGLAVTR